MIVKIISEIKERKIYAEEIEKWKNNKIVYLNQNA